MKEITFSAQRSATSPRSETKDGHTMQSTQRGNTKQSNLGKFLKPALLLTATISLASCGGGNNTANACATAGTCSVTIAATGAPSGASYSVTGPGTTQSGAAGVKAIDKEGAWIVTPAAVSGYTVSPTSAAVSISSSNKTPTVSFTYTATNAAPTIVTMTPANNDKCVRDDAQLVITFDQPMQNSTGSFFSSTSGLSLGAQSWSNGGKTLTATINGLSYSTTPGTPITETFTVTNNGLTGANGIGLSNTAVVNTFQTCVKYTDTIKSDSALNQNLFLNPVAPYTGLPMTLGADNGRDVVSLLTFKLNGLPSAVTPDRIISASLRVSPAATAATPFIDLGVNSSDIFQLWNLTYPSAVTTSTLSAATKVTGNMTPVGPNYTADVLAQLKNDVQNRSSNLDRTQYMLRFAKSITSGSLTSWLRVHSASSNTLTTINGTEPRITVEYLLDN